MNWPIDTATQTAARNFPLPIHSSQPAPQYGGHSTYAATWQHRLLPGQRFLAGSSLFCSPTQIIAEFTAGNYLQGLALVISWGGMGRTQRYVYRQHNLQHVHNTLVQCEQSIHQTNSIQGSWILLANGLSWTPVITSKTLHFFCRALGHQQDPPVPIDNKVILNKVWPRFHNGIPQVHRPLNWKGNSFAHYCRYMTAVLVWANRKKWTTTQLEPTIFFENQ
jgi:hypothetical protein